MEKADDFAKRFNFTANMAMLLIAMPLIVYSPDIILCLCLAMCLCDLGKGVLLKKPNIEYALSIQKTKKCVKLLALSDIISAGLLMSILIILFVEEYSHPYAHGRIAFFGIIVNKCLFVMYQFVMSVVTFIHFCRKRKSINDENIRKYDSLLIT